jgi:fatty-acyl-CoA synthase
MADDMRALFRARADDDGAAVLFEDERVSWRQHVQASLDRASWLLANKPADGPFHVGVLLDNVPEFSYLLGAAAFAGATIVGINPTRRGAEFERDVQHTGCAVLVTEPRYQADLVDLDLGPAANALHVVGSPEWSATLAPHAGATDPNVELDPAAPYLLIFTSGTTGHPKAAICSQARIAVIAENLRERWALTPDDVAYCSMPMFHSNQLMAGWSPTLAAGATLALRRKFSASGFLPDVRKFGVTYMNYVGKPLTYILATPEASDDSDNTLRVAFGNEGAEHDLERFAKRFGCVVLDSYGSTEGSVSIGRTPETPKGALGVGVPGTQILDPETGNECPPAEFDANGRLTNSEACIGEIANRQTAFTFEGYYNNDEANSARIRDGVYWTGDLGYRDSDGFLYFAGRDFDWLRVDGENFAAAPVERILTRHPAVSLAAVYGVPDEEVGDQVMAALILEPGARFEPHGFAAFLADQGDLGTKCAPRYVRVARELPSTETNKILKRVLRRERWECADETWLRVADSYRPLTSEDVGEIRARFVAREREAVLDT